MASFLDEIYDRHPTTFFVTQNMIKLVGNQIVSASLPLLEVSPGLEFYYISNYYVALNVNMMS